MILGFAHVTVGVEWYNWPNEVRGVPSSPLKWVFTANRPKYHDLVVGQGGIVPIEMVNYDTGLEHHPSRIRVMGEAYLHVLARNRDVELAFLSKLGVVEGRLVAVRSQIKRWCVDIYVDERESAPLNPPIDIYGYSALAFYSSNLVDDRQMMIDSGGRDATPIFDVMVGRRKFDVCMMRSYEGTAIELLSVRQ